MVLPIVAYGDPVLRKVAEEIDKDYPNLAQLIENMKDTMKNAKGVGLAAPQIGKAIRLFLVDTRPFAEDDELDEQEQQFLKSFNKVFINAKLIKEEGDEWIFSEGCLSIPNINEDVIRQESITIAYLDEHFNKHVETVDGLAARVIQHEYDHIEGILFTDYLSAFKKRILKGKLTSITRGKVDIDYKMRFPLKA